MKKLLLLIVPLVFLFSCHDEYFSDKFEFEEDNEFKINQKYLSEENNLKIEITNIEDSRCPADVVCVWQGEALVEIELEETQTFSTVLSTYDNQIDTLGNYSVELIDVQPYPLSDQVIKTEDYDITLRIKRINNPD
jgi:hypothetical protein